MSTNETEFREIRGPLKLVGIAAGILSAMIHYQFGWKAILLTGVLVLAGGVVSLTGSHRPRDLQRAIVRWYWSITSVVLFGAVAGLLPWLRG